MTGQISAGWQVLSGLLLDRQTDSCRCGDARTPARGLAGTPPLSKEQQRKLEKYEHLGCILFALSPPPTLYPRVLI